MSLIFPTDTLAKSVLVALDKFLIADSEDGNELKDLTYADLRTNLAFVDGPASAVNNNLAAFDATTGKLIKDSGYKLDDAGINATSLWSAFQIIAQLALKVTGNNSQLPTQAENDALVGAGGTVWSANVYETQYDTTNASTKTATTISFTASTHTIADSGNGFVTAWFKIGTQIVITGSASNNGTFTISSVSAGAIVVLETLVNESAGATVVITTVTANKLLRLDANGRFPTLDARNLTNLPNTPLSIPLWESFTWATTPQSALILDDLYQYIFRTRGRLGTVSSGDDYAWKRAIKIIPRTTVTADNVWVLLGKNNSPADNFLITIETDSAGAPSGTPITNGTSNNVAGSGLTTACVWQSVWFASPYTLTAWTTYWIVFQRSSSTNDTNHYWLGTNSADAEDYGSFDGKSYVSNWNNAETALVTFKIVPSSGSGSKSLWKSDADHGSPAMRQVHGLCVTTGSAWASGTLHKTGIVWGFSSLSAFESYYTDSTAWWVVQNNLWCSEIGEAISATEIMLKNNRVWAVIDCGVVSTGWTNLENCIWVAPFDLDLVVHGASESTACAWVQIIIADAARARTFFFDEYSNGANWAVTVPVRKWQFIKVTTPSAGSAYIDIIPRF